MRRILAALILVVGLVAPARAIMVQRYDCESVQSYGQTQLEDVAAFLTAFMAAGTQDDMGPSGTGWVSLQHIGVEFSLAKLFVMFGWSPVATLNLPLGLVCLRASV